MSKKIFLIFVLIFTAIQANADVTDEFNKLGTNKAIMERAKKLNSKNRYQIVQNRIVDRDNRLELSGQIGMVAGGDAYYDTYNYGGALDFHFNPKFSVGARYYQHSNALTNEGERVYSQAAAQNAVNGIFTRPAIDDYPIATTIGVLNWYPMYGKFNFLDQKTFQFDFYLLAGGGTVKLNESGQVPTYTGGAGVGLWLTQHVSTRAEIRYQGYQEDSSSDNRQMHLTIGTLSLGVMF